MRTAQEGARRSTPPTGLVSDGHGSEALLSTITAWLDDAKAENVVTIPLKGKSSIGDYMIVASGRSDRHVGAIAEQILNIAFAQGVRVREDADLAQLLAAVDVDSEIPVEAFAAVAEILVYVWRANGAAADPNSLGPEPNQPFMERAKGLAG